jgi:hypothetical protein
MAYYLLSMRPDLVVQNLYRLDGLGYTKIPVLYEEALEIYRQRDSTLNNVVLPAIASGRPAADRCERFLKLLKLSDPQSPGSQAAFAEFGTSYFFFFSFGYSAGGKS